MSATTISLFDLRVDTRDEGVCINAFSAIDNRLLKFKLSSRVDVETFDENLAPPVALDALPHAAWLLVQALTIAAGKSQKDPEALVDATNKLGEHVGWFYKVGLTPTHYRKLVGERITQLQTEETTQSASTEAAAAVERAQRSPSVACYQSLAPSPVPPPSPPPAPRPLPPKQPVLTREEFDAGVALISDAEMRSLLVRLCAAAATDLCAQKTAGELAIKRQSNSISASWRRRLGQQIEAEKANAAAQAQASATPVQEAADDISRRLQLMRCEYQMVLDEAHRLTCERAPAELVQAASARVQHLRQLLKQTRQTARRNDAIKAEPACERAE